MSTQLVANKKVLKFILFLIIFLACWYLGRVFRIDVASYQDFLLKFPLFLSGLIFVVLYVGTTTFIWFGPKDVLRISSAILFGTVVSTVFVWIGEMINAAVMFHLSRILGREYVQQRFRVKSQELDQMKDDSSLLGLIAWRINPLIPFRLMDLGFGLTRVSFQKYFIAIVAISFFRILWLQFILAGIGTNIFNEFSAMLNYFLENQQIVLYSALYFLAVFMITMAAVLMRFVRKRKQKKHEPAK